MISSELLVCHLILVGYRMFLTMAISICMDWKTWLSDIHAFSKIRRRENNRSMSCTLAGNGILPQGRYLSCMVVYSYLC